MSRVRVVGLVLACLPLFWGVWGYDLWNPDEPYFAEGAREMLADGHWIVPHVNGVVTTDKPPLFFWLIALAAWPLGGVSSVTARLPSFLAALGSLGLTLRLGRRLYGDKAASSAMLLLAVTYMFWDKARSAQTDAVLSLFILVSLSAFEAFRSGAASPRRAGILFWAAGALGILTKGPVGLLLPLGIALTTLAFDRRLARLRAFAPLSGPLVFAAILACWIVPASLWNPTLYTVGGALREHFVDRAIHGMHHAQPFWYYAQVLPVLLLPWTALVPGALVWGWRAKDPASRFLLIWAAFVVLFFSVSTEKRGLYVLPSAPAYALLLGGWLESSLAAGTSRGMSRRWIRVPLWLSATALVVAGLGLVVVGGKVEAVPRGISAGTGLCLLLTGGLLAATLARGALRRSIVVLGAGVALTYLFVATAVFPALNPEKSAREFARLLARETADSRARGRPVMAYYLRNLPEAFAFYGEGLYTIDTMSLDDLAKHLDRPEKVYAAIDVDKARGLPEDLASRLQIVATARLSRKDVALVHNGGD